MPDSLRSKNFAGQLTSVESHSVLFAVLSTSRNGRWIVASRRPSARYLTKPSVSSTSVLFPHSMRLPNRLTSAVSAREDAEAAESKGAGGETRDRLLVILLSVSARSSLPAKTAAIPIPKVIRFVHRIVILPFIFSVDSWYFR